MKSAHRHCPICGFNSVDVLHCQCFALPEQHPLPAEYDVSSCNTCGFVYADTRGTAADYDRYYADYSKYADQTTSTGGGGNPRDQARLTETAAAIAKHLPDLDAGIVDIGCANGGLLGALKARGYSRLFGIDPASACVENTRSFFNVPAEKGWLLDLPFNTPNSDLVVVSHVLEHVLDLRGAVAGMRSTLRPGGMVYVEVPDAQRYVDYLAAPFQDFNTEHINHFGAAGLENLFTAGGFEAVEIGAKTIEAAVGVGYPALFGFFRRLESVPAAAPVWRQDPDFQKSIIEYITASKVQLARIDSRLAPVLDEPVIVWGTGQLTLKLLAETRLAQASITAFVDGNPINHGKTLRGTKILPPDALKQLPGHPIVIGSMLHHGAITEKIRGSLRLANRIVELV